ncbi:MAG: HU family DNA-binding protein [Muribaculum sp.]|nr:HU family DNA-binding protein [Muribaculum sp.]
MNQKIPFYELAKKIAETNSITDESAEVFLKNFFDLISNTIIEGDFVKINGFGSFSLVKNKNGENVIDFKLDKEISDTINAPFLSFEPVDLNDDVTDEMLSEIEIIPEEPVVINTPVVTEEPTEAKTADIIDEPTEAKTETVSEECIEVEVPIDPQESKIIEETSNSVVPETDIATAVVSSPEPSVRANNSTILEEEPEEFVEHISSDDGDKKAGFGWGFLVGLLVGLALGACAVYLAIDYIFPYGRLSDTNVSSLESSLLLDIDEEESSILNSSTMPTDTIEESTQPTSVETSAPVTETGEIPISMPAQITVTDTIRPGYLIVQMAKKHYGSKDFWAYIYEENKSKIGNPNKMTPGTVLVIPPKDKYGIDASNPESLKKAKNKVGEILSKFK